MICSFSIDVSVALTNHSEGEVEGHAPEAIGCLAHIHSGVFGFQVLDLEAMVQDAVSGPAGVDVPSVLSPEKQGWRVAFDGARQADVTAQMRRLLLLHHTAHPRRS